MGITLPIPPNEDGIILHYAQFVVMAKDAADLHFILATHGAPDKIELTSNTYVC